MALMPKFHLSSLLPLLLSFSGPSKHPNNAAVSWLPEGETSNTSLWDHFEAFIILFLSAVVQQEEGCVGYFANPEEKTLFGYGNYKQALQDLHKILSNFLLHCWISAIRRGTSRSIVPLVLVSWGEGRPGSLSQYGACQQSLMPLI